MIELTTTNCFGYRSICHDADNLVSELDGVEGCDNHERVHREFFLWFVAPDTTPKGVY